MEFILKHKLDIIMHLTGMSWAIFEIILSKKKRLSEEQGTTKDKHSLKIIWIRALSSITISLIIKEFLKIKTFILIKPYL